MEQLSEQPRGIANAHITYRPHNHNIDNNHYPGRICVLGDILRDYENDYGIATMNRRNFLKSMIVLGAAPAIVSAGSLMKIWVPPEKKVMTLADWAKNSKPIDHDVIDILNENNEIFAGMQFEPNDKINIDPGEDDNTSIWFVSWDENGLNKIQKRY